MFMSENLQEKWKPVLEHPDLPKIEDSYKRAVTSVILENQERAIAEERSALGERLVTVKVLLQVIQVDSLRLLQTGIQFLFL